MKDKVEIRLRYFRHVTVSERMNLRQPRAAGEWKRIWSKSLRVFSLLLPAYFDEPVDVVKYLPFAKRMKDVIPLKQIIPDTVATENPDRFITRQRMTRFVAFKAKRYKRNCRVVRGSVDFVALR